MAKSDFGEFNPDGTIKKDVTHSIISGRETQPGDVLKRVSGTPFFYRVLAGEHRQMTQELRTELEAQVKPATETAEDFPRMGNSGEIVKQRQSAPIEKKEK